MVSIVKKKKTPRKIFDSSCTVPSVQFSVLPLVFWSPVMGRGKKIGKIIVLIVIKMYLTLLRKIQVLYFEVLKEILMRTIFF